MDHSRHSRVGVVAWINFSSVIPRLDRGIQLKILKLLVLKVVFLDTIVKQLDDTEDNFRSMATTTTRE